MFFPFSFLLFIMIMLLQAVPETLRKLKKVRAINLDRNRISAIPPDILRGCAMLQTLSLHLNPITPEVRPPLFQENDLKRDGLGIDSVRALCTVMWMLGRTLRSL